MKTRQIKFHGKSEKELRAVNPKIVERFAYALDCLSEGVSLTVKTKSMNGLGDGVTELKINGKPAYRLVYVIKDDTVHVLHFFVKTSDGTDKKHEDTIKERRKNIK